MSKTPKPWRVQVLKKSKARKAEVIFVTNGPDRFGYLPSIEAAQAECDRRNTLARATADA